MQRFRIIFSVVLLAVVLAPHSLLASFGCQTGISCSINYVNYGFNPDPIVYGQTYTYGGNPGSSGTTCYLFDPQGNYLPSNDNPAYFFGGGSGNYVTLGPATSADPNSYAITVKCYHSNLYGQWGATPNGGVVCPSGQFGTPPNCSSPVPVINGFNASATFIPSGTAVNVSWNTVDMASCSNPIDGSTVNGNSGAVGTGPLTATRTYSLSCTGLNGQTYTAGPITVNVCPQGGFGALSNSYFIASGGSGTVNSAYGRMCVTNYSGSQYFIPVASQAEWDNFRAAYSRLQIGYQDF